MENGEFMADSQKVNEQNHEVFISYSSKNAEYANAVHEKLENAGIKCWIDYNNIRTSQNFAQEIVDGLNKAKVVVLIYSKDADNSKYVYREIETAFDKRHIVPLKIDDSFPDNLEFFFRSLQWLDASPTALKKNDITLESRYDELVETVKEIKDIPYKSHGIAPPKPQEPRKKSFFEKYGKLVIVAVALLVVVGGFLAYNSMGTDSSGDELNKTAIDIGYIGLQDNGGGSYSYNVYGSIEGANASSKDVIHVDFYDKNGKVVDSSDTEIGDADGNILGSSEVSQDDISKVSVELQDKDKKVLSTAESDNIMNE